MGTQDDSTETTYGGSVVYSKLERYPAMVRIWAGYAFSKDHNEERGHTYAQVDQENTQRVKLVEQASRQEMRTYVCAQCRVEYYFLGDDKVLTFPWSQGLTIDDIEAHYDQYEFKDWTHAETNAPMIKIQHPEYEMWSTSLHARSGVACADCHMPYRRVGAMKVSDHHVRSPLLDVAASCQTCHRVPESELLERAHTIQDRTVGLI
ncbi:MAG TPA: ammonia-forming cytochrome c nitrite reductase subunit c552, partial [Anaerolineae bacterium]